MRYASVVLPAAFVLTFLLHPAPVFGQRVGEYVMVIVDQAPLKHEEEVVERLGIGLDVPIEDINGDWFWVQWRTAGWIYRPHVLPRDQAEAHFTRQIGQNPGNGNAYRARGNARLRRNALDLAIADHTEAIRLNPADAAALGERGRALDLKGEHDRAIADFTESLRLDPSDAVTFNNRGASWNFKGEHDKAIRDYNEAIRLHPEFAAAYSNRGVAWSARREYDKALEDCNEAIRLDPKSALAYNSRGSAWQGKCDYDKAIADYREAVALDPSLASAYASLAWIQATCGDDRYRNGNEASANARQACDLTDWKAPGILEVFAAACAENGDFDQAQQWQVKVIELTTPESEKELARARLELYKQRKPLRP